MTTIIRLLFPLLLGYCLMSAFLSMQVRGEIIAFTCDNLKEALATYKGKLTEKQKREKETLEAWLNREGCKPVK